MDPSPRRCVVVVAAFFSVCAERDPRRPSQPPRRRLEKAPTRDVVPWHRKRLTRTPLPGYPPIMFIMLSPRGIRGCGHRSAFCDTLLRGDPSTASDDGRHGTGRRSVRTVNHVGLGSPSVRTRRMPSGPWRHDDRCDPGGSVAVGTSRWTFERRQRSSPGRDRRRRDDGGRRDERRRTLSRAPAPARALGPSGGWTAHRVLEWSKKGSCVRGLELVKVTGGKAPRLKVQSPGGREGEIPAEGVVARGLNRSTVPGMSGDFCAGAFARVLAENGPW